jgi:polyphosphate kinase 2 (PPK2 family)
MATLGKLKLRQSLDKPQYNKLVKAWQFELLTLQQHAVRVGVRAIVNMEGMDAAGKGGSIRRLVEIMDPRGYKVYRIGAPEAWEQSRHYLFRFWTKVPPPGELAIFDRSWYGRVLVERVEKLVPKADWKRAYDEINEFERGLVNNGVPVIKLWFHIDPDEQLKRFEARLADPFKVWKMTDEDWRNRGKWDDYVAAAEEMFKRTDTALAPWTLVPANNKHFARIMTIQTVCKALRRQAELNGIKLPKPTVKAVSIK